MHLVPIGPIDEVNQVLSDRLAARWPDGKVRYLLPFIVADHDFQEDVAIALGQLILLALDRESDLLSIHRLDAVIAYG